MHHISEMFSLKGGGIPGDLGARSASRLAILPGTTHVSLLNQMGIIVPMINDLLDAKQSALARHRVQLTQATQSVEVAWSKLRRIIRRRRLSRRLTSLGARRPTDCPSPGSSPASSSVWQARSR
jgi:hypothetical protein